MLPGKLPFVLLMCPLDMRGRVGQASDMSE